MQGYRGIKSWKKRLRIPHFKRKFSKKKFQLAIVSYFFSYASLTGLEIFAKATHLRSAGGWTARGQHWETQVSVFLQWVRFQTLFLSILSVNGVSYR